jgi:hypothetical protein
MSLTGPERETVITFSDEDDTATVHPHQRRIITKLKNNPAAELIEDISFDGTAGAVFEIPADLVSFRSKKRQGREISTAERAGSQPATAYGGSGRCSQSVPGPGSSR